MPAEAALRPSRAAPARRQDHGLGGLARDLRDELVHHPPAHLDEDVDHLFADNHADAPARLTASGTDLLTGAAHAGEVEVPTGGVVVVRERTGA